MVEVTASAVIPAPIATVWSLVRDFNGLPQWHPAVKASRIEDDRAADAIGAVRNFQLQDGSTIRERLLMLSDAEHGFSYAILESGLGVEDYVATVRLLPVTDADTTYISWSARFNTAPGQEEAVGGAIANGVFKGGLDALKARFA